MGRTSRLLSLGAGLTLLGFGAWWALQALDRQPLYRYGLEWFLKLSPAEAVFLRRLLLPGLLGTLGIAWGLAPWIRSGARAVPFRPGLLGLAGAALLATAVTGSFVLRNQVVTDDEYVYLFQARTLLTGHAALPAPPMPEFHTNAFVLVREGRWFGQYPQGHPLALAAGAALGAPRFVSFFLAAVNLVLVGSILRRLAGPGWALAGAALLAVSPLYVLTGATLLSHSSALFGLSLGVLGALCVADRDRWGWGLVAGLGLGFLFVTRPWTGLTLGLFPAALLGRALVARRHHRASALAFLGLVLCAVGFLAYNHGVSGDPFTTGYQAVRGEGQREFGFGTIVPGIHAHTPVQGLANVLVLSVRFAFWAWGSPFLLLLFVPALLRPPKAEGLPGKVAVWGAAAMLGVGLLSYFPYWSVGVNDTGPVKTYELLLPASVLATLGLKAARERFGGWAPAWAAASVLAAAVLFWPPQIRHLRDVTTRVREPLALVERTVKKPALVFVSGVQTPRPGSWVFGRPNPRPDLSDPVLYVADLGPENLEYRGLHPERHPYRLLHREGAFRVIPLGTEKR